MAAEMERGAYQTQHVISDWKVPLHAPETAHRNEQPQFLPSVSIYVPTRGLHRNAKHQQPDRRRILRLEEEPELSLRYERKQPEEVYRRVFQGIVTKKSKGGRAF